MVNGTTVPYSGASASDSHRLPNVARVEGTQNSLKRATGFAAACGVEGKHSEAWIRIKQGWRGARIGVLMGVGAVPTRCATAYKFSAEELPILPQDSLKCYVI